MLVIDENKNSLLLFFPLLFFSLHARAMSLQKIVGHESFALSPEPLPQQQQQQQQPHPMYHPMYHHFPQQQQQNQYREIRTVHNPHASLAELFNGPGMGDFDGGGNSGMFQQPNLFSFRPSQPPSMAAAPLVRESISPTAIFPETSSSSPPPPPPVSQQSTAAAKKKKAKATIERRILPSRRKPGRPPISPEETESHWDDVGGDEEVAERATSPPSSPPSNDSPSPGSVASALVPRIIIPTEEQLNDPRIIAQARRNRVTVAKYLEMRESSRVAALKSRLNRKSDLFHLNENVEKLLYEVMGLRVEVEGLRKDVDGLKASLSS